MLYTLRKTRQDKTALVRFIPGSSLVSLPIGSLPAMLLKKNETKRNETKRNDHDHDTFCSEHFLRDDYERITRGFVKTGSGHTVELV